MIIHIDRSKLFTIEPAVRFAKEYGVPKELWVEMWRRHTLLSYSNDELCEYLHLKTGRKPKARSVKRWILKTEIYCLANHLVRMGVRVVSSDYFGEFEPFVIEELTRGIRFSGAQYSENIV